MDKRIKISSIQIRNFRSIRNEIITPKDLSIFVGTNDAGKSNVLKALNLFFNEQTDYNTQFDFSKDFTFLFPKASHSTKEIKIVIKFDIPDTYTESGEYVWTQTWRINNNHKEIIQNGKGKLPSARSRVVSALKRIKYRYVPAVKSRNYYKTLLGDLYGALSASLDNPLLESSNNFTNALREYTIELKKEISERLNIISELSVPSNLNDIFEALVFETTEGEKGIHVPLTSRGDGIQACHIPSILRFIAQVDQRSRNMGSMKVCTIWGFEEPENGLELTKTFLLATEFTEYSQDIQIFMTTHSPAFYMKKDTSGAIVYYVSKRSNNEDTVISAKNSTALLAENMGLMPLVAPFILEQEKQLSQAKEICENNFLTDINTVMVEGKTDIQYIKKAISVLSPRLNAMIENGTLRVICKNDGAGTTQLKNWVVAWIYAGFVSKLFVLFDNDSAGEKAKEEITQYEIFRSKSKNSVIKLSKIEPSDEIIAILDKNIALQYEIEHLFSLPFWKYMKSKGLIKKRDTKEIETMFSRITEYDRSLKEIVEEVQETMSVKNLLIQYEPKDGKKSAIAKEVENWNESEELFNGFRRTINKMEECFTKE